MSVYPFIEAEKAQQRNVKRACELLEVSRAAFCARLAGPSRRARADADLPLVRRHHLHPHLGRVAFVATVTGIASRRVAGYAMADHLRTSLVADALGNAVAARDPGPGVIFHSDRGCRYTSAEFASLAEDCQVAPSRTQGPVPG